MKIGDRIFVRGYIEEIRKDTVIVRYDGGYFGTIPSEVITRELPSAEPEHLTDDDFETIRIHLSALKESLCNQGRWKEAEDYERLISRFMSFASAQPERRKGRWRKGVCECGYDWAKDAPISSVPNFCPQCGADMRQREE